MSQGHVWIQIPSCRPTGLLLSAVDTVAKAHSAIQVSPPAMAFILIHRLEVGLYRIGMRKILFDCFATNVSIRNGTPLAKKRRFIRNVHSCRQKHSGVANDDRLASLQSIEKIASLLVIGLLLLWLRVTCGRRRYAFWVRLVGPIDGERSAFINLGFGDNIAKRAGVSYDLFVTDLGCDPSIPDAHPFVADVSYDSDFPRGGT